MSAEGKKVRGWNDGIPCFSDKTFTNITAYATMGS